MATREENLKKINDELEKIAGGAYLAMNRNEKEPDVNIENQGQVINRKLIFD